MSKPPETSVIIPVRNGQAFVAQALTSVLVQLKGADEVLVVDDASHDQTCDRVAALGDKRVWILSADGAGVSKARNLGLSQARGLYVAFLDHDDLWPQGRQEALLAALAADTAIAAVYGKVRMLIEPGAPPTRGALGLDGRHVRELVGSGLFRREALQALGGFAEDMRLREDADFTFRLDESGAAARLCDVDALIYRRHAGNVTNDEAALDRALVEVARRRMKRLRAVGATSQ